MKSFLSIASVLLLLGMLDGGSVSAQSQGGTQTPRPAAAQNPAPQASPETADLAITATVTARELRFDVVPNPDVKFTGHPERNTVWDAQRENLPRPVQPGVTYRDIGIRLTITSVFADIDRIVAEALGEVPPSDDTPAQEKPQETSPQQQPPALPPPSATPPQPRGGRP